MLRSLARLVGLRAPAKRQGRPTKRYRSRPAVEALDGRCVPAALLAGSALLPDHAAAVVHSAEDHAAEVQTAEAGKVSMQDFHFVRKIDKATPSLGATGKVAMQDFHFTMKVNKASPIIR